jgi:hypothetical protein
MFISMYVSSVSYCKMYVFSAWNLSYNANFVILTSQKNDSSHDLISPSKESKCWYKFLPVCTRTKTSVFFNWLTGRKVLYKNYIISIVFNVLWHSKFVWNFNCLSCPKKLQTNVGKYIFRQNNNAFAPATGPDNCKHQEWNTLLLALYCEFDSNALICRHAKCSRDSFCCKMSLPKDCLYSLIKSCNYACCISQLTKFHSINPLKPKLVKIIFKNPGRTSKKTQYFTSTKIDLLALFKETVAVRITQNP